MFLLCISVLLLVFGQTVKDVSFSALSFCAHALIPALFPFFVLSDLFCKSGVMASLPRTFVRILRYLGIRQSEMAPVLLGLICGFPVGASVLQSEVESGAISVSDAEKLLPICTAASPAFCILGIGLALFDSLSFGVALYLAQLLGALILLRLFQRGGEGTLPPQPPEPALSSLLPAAIAQAAQKMLSVCGFVLFFQILCALLSVCVPMLPPFLHALFCGVLELTAGARAAALLPCAQGQILCGAICGFGSVSVLIQVAFVTRTSLSLRYYLAGKGVCALICAVFASLICLF